jgi:hypothetical protein
MTLVNNLQNKKLRLKIRFLKENRNEPKSIAVLFFINTYFTQLSYFHILTP